MKSVHPLNWLNWNGAIVMVGTKVLTKLVSFTWETSRDESGKSQKPHAQRYFDSDVLTYWCPWPVIHEMALKGINCECRDYVHKSVALEAWTQNGSLCTHRSDWSVISGFVSPTNSMIFNNNNGLQLIKFVIAQELMKSQRKLENMKKPGTMKHLPFTSLCSVDVRFPWGN